MSNSRTSRRRIQKAARHYQEHGCGRCARKLSFGAALVLEDGKAVCETCVAPSDRSIGEFLITSATSAALLSDTAWARSNPEAQWRLREPFHGELLEIRRREDYLSAVLGRPAVQAEEEPTHVLVVVRGDKIMRRACTPPPVPELTGLWAARMSENLLACAEESIAEQERLMPEVKQHAAYAGATLALPSIAETFLGQAKAQGAAMRESQGKTRQ